MIRRETYVAMPSAWEQLRIKRRRIRAAQARRDIATALLWALMGLCVVVFAYGVVLGFISLYDFLHPSPNAGQLPTL